MVQCSHCVADAAWLTSLCLGQFPLRLLQVIHEIDQVAEGSKLTQQQGTRRPPRFCKDRATGANSKGIPLATCTSPGADTPPTSAGHTSPPPS